MVGTTAEGLRAWIREGRLRAGDTLDSEHRLAETLGVSRGTIRLAIDVLVSTGELTRRPHSRPVIGMLGDRSSGSEGLDVYVWVSHPISDHASLMFMRGVSLGLKGTPYRMIVREPTRFYGGHVPSDERQFLIDLLENEGAAGAIIQRDAAGKNAEAAKTLLRAGKPLVFVDSPPPEGVDADYVGSSNLAAARQCVEHLIELGHQRIACLMESDETDVTNQRTKGYWRAMRLGGLEDRGVCLIAGALANEGRHLHPAGRFAPRCATHGAYLEWSQRLVAAVLALPERPTAVFVGCDVLAHSVGALLEGAGVRIPEDMSIVGFDWLARWESAQIDDLTTASQDFEGFGRQSADLLLDRLTGEASATPRHVLLPAPLVVRSSTAPRKAAMPSGDHLGSKPL
ncbi:transcriptional regulator [Fimbriimonas ginsengisoli Gsoil 348]|uniref:Transcriptional regulator n=2 Tax=Fimbriimonas ginsengisoli TaxID=1005039 RepID=A0A068NJL6_FIMGI|nr:transcriptional regulator [Fimbriimonas ginsengisoli Gsoil 348]